MRHFFKVAGAVTLGALWALGCSSSGSSGGGGSGAGGSGAGGTAGNGGSAGSSADAQCTGDYVSLTQSQLDAQVDSSGKCAGDSDRAVVCSSDTTMVAEQCGSSCYKTAEKTDEAQQACVVSCMNGAVTPALSADCVDCYATDIGCARTNCLLSCGIAPTSAGCATCRAQHGCASAFFSCSGLPNLAATGGSGGSGDSSTDGGGAGGSDSVPSAGTGGS